MTITETPNHTSLTADRANQIDEAAKQFYIADKRCKELQAQLTNALALRHEADKELSCLLPYGPDEEFLVSYINSQFPVFIVIRGEPQGDGPDCRVLQVITPDIAAAEAIEQEHEGQNGNHA